MALTIKQGFEYKEKDWWKWWVWIDGPADELNKIDHVVYTLHPTFPRPVRTVRERESKFRLETAGWGVFTIYATVVGHDGLETELSHDLRLEYPDGTPTLA
jgi:transcription initiation factor IIF auxiliary subunit